MRKFKRKIHLGIIRKKCHRWKIVDEARAKNLGITKLIPDNNGYIKVDVASIPPGMFVEDVLIKAEKYGILLHDSYVQLLHRKRNGKIPSF